jgi:hypothetical protein
MIRLLLLALTGYVAFRVVREIVDSVPSGLDHTPPQRRKRKDASKPQRSGR